jgi:hypothetical protein
VGSTRLSLFFHNLSTFIRATHWSSHEMHTRQLSALFFMLVSHSIASGVETFMTACEVSSSTNCNCSLCTNHGSTYLSGLCCAYQGVPASLLAFEEDDRLSPRLSDFNGCTGAKVTHSYVAGGEDSMQEALEADVGTRYIASGGTVVSTEGGGVHDAYIVQAPWIPTVILTASRTSLRASQQHRPSSGTM